MHFCAQLKKEWNYLFQVDELDENNQRERTLQRVGKQHLRNLRSIHDQHRLNVQAVQDQHDEQLQAIEENGRLSPTKFNQVQEELRRVELLDHNKKVKALEKKNTEQEKKHARMIMMLDRVVDSQDNQLKHQKFETGEQLREHTQELKELKEQKELREKEVKEVEVEQERKHSQELMYLIHIRHTQLKE